MITPFITLFRETAMNDEAKSPCNDSLAPRASDVLFGPDDDYGTNACIAHWDAEGLYSSGYRTAALHLAEPVCTTRSDRTA
jgi:hypothetical protein